ncbi:PhoH family protein [Yunchengibacter salinarum]|uniref:PhoH family protein n=1 Tax=Yunchengibacter salinarum TaxID=3133399 RepID=UPI0035B5ED00
MIKEGELPHVMETKGKSATGTGDHRRVVEFADNGLAAQVFGEHDRHLARIEDRLGIVLINRGNRIAIEGTPERADQAERVLTDLYDMVKTGLPLEPADVDGVIRMVDDGLVAEPATATGSRPVVETPDADGSALKIATRNKVILPRSKGQASYMQKLAACEMVFGVGPAGTGKTYLAVAMAVARLLKGEVDRVILSRPAVEAGENLGFLPGDLKEKVDPYLRPLYDALYDMVPPDQVEKRMNSGQIEIAPLAYMRGRTLSNAAVILDEAQNTTVMQMKMFLTRFGENSSMTICGDPSQVDLPGGAPSGLRHALDILRDVDEIGVVRFTSADVVRHPLVSRIIDAYDGEGNA